MQKNFRIVSFVLSKIKSNEPAIETNSSLYRIIMIIAIKQRFSKEKLYLIAIHVFLFNHKTVLSSHAYMKYNRKSIYIIVVFLNSSTSLPRMYV